MPSVEAVAARMCRSLHGVEFADLRQIGYVALLEALPKYDPECGASVKTYIERRIHGAMLDHARGEIPKGMRRMETRPTVTRFSELDPDPTEGHEGPCFSSILARDDKSPAEGEEHVRSRLKAILGDRDGDMVFRCVVLEQRQSEAAEAHGVSESYVSQIIMRSLAYLRDVIDVDGV